MGLTGSPGWCLEDMMLERLTNALLYLIAVLLIVGGMMIDSIAETLI